MIKKKAALIDVDLARINFVRSQSVNNEKDELYIDAIIKMEKKFSNVPYSTLISFYKAQYYYSEGSKYDPNGSDEYKWDTKKALEICNSAIENFLTLSVQVNAKVASEPNTDEKFKCSD